MTQLLSESAPPPTGDALHSELGEALRGDMISRHGYLPASPRLRPLRIAVIGGRGVPSNYSGIEHIWEQLYGLLAARGHRITIYCRPRIITGERGTHRGMRLVTTKAPIGGPLETVTHSYAAMKHACTKGDVHEGGKPFDLITLHALPPQVWAGMPKKHGIPLVSHVHGLDWQRARWKNTPFGIGSKLIKAGERRMVRLADGIAVCADNLSDYYRETYGVESTVIHNGVLADDAPFEPSKDTLARFGLTPGKFIVSIGRLVPEKRLQDTIQAFGKLKDLGLKFAVVGEGDDQARLQAMAPDGVVFTGLQKGNALDTLFRSAAVYVTASELEGLPSSVLEAMEKRVPVVASRIPPHESLLRRVPAYDSFFETYDVEGLATKVRRLVTSPVLSRQQSASQQTFVRSEFSWPKLAHRAEQFYLGLVQQVNPSA